MSKIAVCCDSNAGITQEMGKKLGVRVIPMPFFIDGEEYLEGVSLNAETFFNKMEKGSAVSTSQPSAGMLMEAWDELLLANDYVLYFPMSSGLSKACETATILSHSEEYKEKVFVIDNGRIAAPEAQSIFDALSLIEKNIDIHTIVRVLQENGMEHDIFIMLDTLDYLKKGGRITPAAAALGGFLKLKPVLMIKGKKLDSYKMRNRTTEGGMQILKDACRKCMEGYLKEDPASEFYLEVAYSGKDITNAEKLKKEIMEEFGVEEVLMLPLSLSISCHTGPGALGMAVVKRIPKEIKKDIYIEKKEDTFANVSF